MMRRTGVRLTIGRASWASRGFGLGNFMLAERGGGMRYVAAVLLVWTLAVAASAGAEGVVPAYRATPVVYGAGWATVHPDRGGAGGEREQPTKFAVNDELDVDQITPGIWRHVSYTELEDFGRSPANGLLVTSGDEAALIDTPWTDQQTTALFAWTKETLKCSIRTVVVTHSHADNLGGLIAAHELGAQSYAFNKTAELARNEGKEVPQHVFADHFELRVGARTLELRYAGAGHTVDNIVVWIPDDRVLFGGCLVRSARAKTLGYTAEADLVQWPETIAAVREAYAPVKVVVPGHGSTGGTELFDRTLEQLSNRINEGECVIRGVEWNRRQSRGGCSLGR